MCVFVKSPEVASPKSLCCCFYSLCANPVNHTGFPKLPVLCSGLNPLALVVLVSLYLAKQQEH